MMEEVLLTVDRKVSNYYLNEPIETRPGETCGHFEMQNVPLNDRVLCDFEGNIPDDAIKNNGVYGSKWNYSHVTVKFKTNEGRDKTGKFKAGKYLGEIRTFNGFVGTKTEVSQYGPVGESKWIDPSTKIIYCSPRTLNATRDEMKTAFVSERFVPDLITGDHTRTNQVSVVYTAKEDPDKLLANLCGMVNNTKKESAAEKLNNLKKRVQKNLDKMDYLTSPLVETYEEPTLTERVLNRIMDDDGRTM